MKKLRSIWDFQASSKSFRVAYFVDQMVEVSEVMERTGASRDLVLGVVRKMYGDSSLYPGRSQNGFAGTKCWDCTKAVGGCSWSRSFRPVEGWDATPTRVKADKDADTGEQHWTDSFYVNDCPEFEKDRRVR